MASRYAGGDELTERQLEVLTLAAQGYSNEAIGRRLFLSLDTVKTHMVRTCRTLGARDRTHASALAVQRELITIPDQAR